MARVILDSSILVAIINKADRHHDQVIAKVGVIENTYGISAITLVETLIHAFQESDAEGDRIKDRIDDAIDFCVEMDESIAIEAAKIRAKTGLKTPDSIISATAKVRLAELWTLDQRLAKAHKGAVLVA